MPASQASVGLPDPPPVGRGCTLAAGALRAGTGPTGRRTIVDLSRATWRKSSRSGGNGCVEVAFVGGKIAVRDSKDKSGPALTFTPHEWDAFVGGVRDGEFDRP